MDHQIAALFHEFHVTPLVFAAAAVLSDLPAVQAGRARRDQPHLAPLHDPWIDDDAVGHAIGVATTAVA